MLVTTPRGGCSVFREGDGGTEQLPRGPGWGGWTAPWALQPPSRGAGVCLYFASGEGRGGQRGSCPAPHHPGWVVPCISQHRAQGTEGPGRPCVSPPPRPAPWTCPPGAAVWRSAWEVRTPEGCCLWDPRACRRPRPPHPHPPSLPVPFQALPNMGVSPVGASSPTPQRGSEICRPLLLL